MSPSSSSPAAAPPAPPPAGRADVPERYRWDLSDLFAEPAAWETAFGDLAARVEGLARLRGSVSRSADSMASVLRQRDEVFAELDRLALYAGASYHEDMSVPAGQGRWDRVQTLSTRAAEAVSWLVPEILSVPREALSSWTGSNPDLSVYAHFLADLDRQRPHILSTREEELLAMAGEMASAPENIYSRFTNTNLDFPVIVDEQGASVRLTAAKYSALIYSRDRRVRRDAFAGMHETYLAKAGSLSAMLSGHVKQHIFYARARGYPGCLEAALDGPNIPVAVYDNLIATVGKNVGRLHRYVALRRRMLGLPEIHAYDLYVPLVDAGEERIAYDEAAETVCRALTPLGGEYLATLRRAIDSRWIDVYETPNKRSGAYSWGCYLCHPYLLLNYNGTLHDRSTLAHELGHALHSWYTVRHQPMIYGHYATFCAEVASTVNEVLLADDLLRHARNDDQRLAILQQQIDAIRTTVFRQTLFAEYERLIHRLAEAGEPLTGDVLCRAYGDMVARYYGSELAMDEAARAEGLRIPHFYRDFYVYTYATSHCAAVNIGRRILAGEPGAAEGLIRFLSAGSSRYPLEVLRLAGVDMTTPRLIEDTLDYFDDLVNQFAALRERRR